MGRGNAEKLVGACSHELQAQSHFTCNVDAEAIASICGMRHFLAYMIIRTSVRRS
jgi:hypothetical protein